MCVVRENKQDLGDHVVVIVVPQGTRQLLVVHCRLVLPLTPHLCNRLGAVQFELPVGRHPLNDLAVPVVCQQLQQKLPQLDLSVVAYTFHKTTHRYFKLTIQPENDLLPSGLVAID